ncbi:hypothetical protein C0991_006032 [Blastosporella zonata]|nr:hypothetical protein C0991_006032 [Blastosporella zonata]
MTATVMGSATDSIADHLRPPIALRLPPQKIALKASSIYLLGTTPGPVSYPTAGFTQGLRYDEQYDYASHGAMLDNWKYDYDYAGGHVADPFERNAAAWEKVTKSPNTHNENLVALYRHILMKDLGKAKETSSIAGCALWKYHNGSISILSQFLKGTRRLAIVRIAKRRELTGQSNNLEKRHRLETKD